VTAVFYISAVTAVVATLLVITSANAVHALLYLILSLFSVALTFFSLGAPFAAALEVIIYAGAIMVLFVFVIMILNLGPQVRTQDRAWITPRNWAGPMVLAAILSVEVLYVIAANMGEPVAATEIGPKAVGISLFGPYLVAVELASMLLLAGLVGAYHLGRNLKSHAASDREGS
jgi:NADH-quinone oxidoreductase subunit J